MDEMQRKYEEELKALRNKYDTIRQQRSGKDLVPSTPNLLGSFKQPEQPRKRNLDLHERNRTGKLGRS